MGEELNNALAWFRAAPGRLYDGTTQNLKVTAQWIWEVIQGDFNEDQTTSQVVTGTIISMVPFVDQLCDVRDVVANCKKINQDSSNKWHWVALALTLIGLFPTLGSLVKGCFKVVFAYGRKGMFSAGKAALDADMWKASKPYIEAGVGKLNDFLARPEVRKTLSALKIDSPYKYLADQLRAVAGKVNVGSLTAAFDTAIKSISALLEKVQKWGPQSLANQATQLMTMVSNVRKGADNMLGQALAPLQNWLNKLAQRLDVEHRLNHPVHTNALNPHSFSRFSLDAEIEALKKAPPEWAKVGKEGAHMPLKKAPAIPPGHFDIGPRAGRGMKDVFENFHSARADVLPPGTVLYRVLAPNSADNGVYWMTKAEFSQLRSKGGWRERFAVWRNWNINGEFATYTVPPGPGLPVWRGATASQPMKDGSGNVVKANASGDGFWLQGGAEQIVVNPADLQRAQLGKRQFTGWGYDEGGINVSLVGVPVLQTNWK
ncbi:MAG: hypothetical protein RJA98_670 [Pseudomonadota bacterium]|jgi:hypothetical protein